MGRRGRSEVVVIFWRDIPAQVNSQIDRERTQLLLSEKFQRAIDRAKRKAGIYTAQEDVAQWRRVSPPFEGDLAQATKTEVDRIEAEYSERRLGQLAFAGGWERDIEAADAVVAPSDASALAVHLADLEELNDSSPSDARPMGQQ